MRTQKEPETDLRVAPVHNYHDSLCFSEIHGPGRCTPRVRRRGGERLQTACLGMETALSRRQVLASIGEIHRTVSRASNPAMLDGRDVR